MRIAHVISGLPAESGGPSRACLDIVRWQALLGNDCTILTARHDGPTFDIGPALAAGAAITEFEFFGPFKLKYTPTFSSYLRAHGHAFDLFVLHGSYQYPTWAAARFCHSARIPYIFTPHGSLDPAVRKKHPRRNRFLDRVYHDRVIRNAAAWHFTSTAEQDNCERPIWRRSFVEPLGIDIDAVPRGERTNAFRHHYGIPDDATLFLFLSRITRKKGIDILLESFSRLTEERTDAWLALCGPVDADLSALVDQAQTDPKLGGRLIVTGLILDDRKDEAFFDADCFVLPTYSENFGIAAFEALAYGLPVITTTGMNLHERLRESGRALIVEPRAPDLHAALKRVVEKRWQPTESVEKARAWLDAEFSWRQRAAAILRQYESALAAA